MQEHDVADLALAPDGAQRIDFADRTMPVLAAIRRRFTDEKPLAGVRIAACLHVTAETANLVRTLVAGGAQVTLAASNPLSTQDDTAAALVHDGVAVFARSGVDLAGYYAHIESALAIEPDLVLDDGCDLLNMLHTTRPDLGHRVRAGCEETTTGVIRLREMARAGVLKFPVVAVNDTPAKRLLDNRYGTGQSTFDAILRATNTLIAGRVVVVAGYGSCGQGVASRARGLGAQVVVTEVDPIRALDATMDGFRVLPMADAAPIGNVFITVTGNRDVIRAEHLEVMRDGAILANAGHFDVEVDVRALHDLADERRRVRPHTDEFTMADGRRLLLLAEGRVVNLAAAEGHPAAVMDVAFADQALTAEWLVGAAGDLSPGVYDVPAEIDARVATLTLLSIGVSLDTLSPDQQDYLRSWQYGS
ncbi:MAG: adenosylhomocysteinase [Frankiales bacterium]|nr:adenosylhomocysteinase [Frankiales bacterium]